MQLRGCGGVGVDTRHLNTGPPVDRFEDVIPIFKLVGAALAAVHSNQAQGIEEKPKRLNATYPQRSV